MATNVAANTQIAPIQLQWKNKRHPVVVTPADEDRFCITVDEAIHACKAASSSAKFTGQFKVLLDYLADWLRQNKKIVQCAYLTVRDAGLMFLPVKKEVPYNRAFENSLTDLDLAVANDPNFDLIKLSVLSLPPVSNDAINSFISTEPTPLFYTNAN